MGLPSPAPRPLVTQRTAAPTRKVTASTTAGGLAGVLIWIGGIVGLDIPPEVAAWLAVALGNVVAYFVKDRVNV